MNEHYRSHDDHMTWFVSGMKSNGPEKRLLGLAQWIQEDRRVQERMLRGERSEIGIAKEDISVEVANTPNNP